MARRREAAFTLVEILVVIGIISVLAAILTPVFMKAKGKALQINCVSNLRHIGMAARLYAQDWDGRVFANYDAYDPNPDIQGSYRFHAIHYYRSYLSGAGLVNCPTLGPGQISYGQNVGLGWGVNSPRIDLESSNAFPTNPYRKSPADLILFAECSQVWFWEFRSGDGASSLFPRLRCHHTAGLNVAYFDGHARWRKFATLNVLEFGGPWPGRGPDQFQQLRCENE